MLPGLFDPAKVEQPSGQPTEPIDLDQGSTGERAFGNAAATSATGRTAGKEVLLKENDEEMMTNEEAKSRTPARLMTALDARVPSGRIGKLTVHASGRVMLSWGGGDDDSKDKHSELTTFELHRGTEATFLQDVVLADIPPADQGRPQSRDDDDDADDDEDDEGHDSATVGGGDHRAKVDDGRQGNAKVKRVNDRKSTSMACGVAGLSTKFVITPDWRSLLS